jgi:hypothetical protein
MLQRLGETTIRELLMAVGVLVAVLVWLAFILGLGYAAFVTRPSSVGVGFLWAIGFLIPFLLLLGGAVNILAAEGPDWLRQFQGWWGSKRSR